MEALRAERRKLIEEFSAVERRLQESTHAIDRKISELHKKLRETLKNETLNSLSPRDKAKYSRISCYSEEAAYEWLRTKVKVLREPGNYTSSIRRGKSLLGYSRVNRDYVDQLITRSKARLQIIMQSYNINKSKTPMNDSEHFGVEIEFFTSHFENDYDQFKESFQHFCWKNKIKGAQLKGDSSISPDESDCITAEIVVCVEKNNLRELELVCQYLKKIEAKVNRSCGMHVHLDFRNRDDLMTARNRLSRALPWLALLVPKSRRNNSYCELRANNLTNDSSRYCAINVQSYRKYKTLEVRLHSGTTSFEKITGWLMILTNIIDNKNFSTETPADKNIDTFIEKLDFKSDNINYYIYDRYKKLNSVNAVEEERGME